MQGFGLAENDKTFDLLLAAYGENHRHYHTADHVTACLRHLDSARECAQKPCEVELALWFHDAIYKPLASNNELKSANWAKKFLEQNKVLPTTNTRVYDLILATLHNAPARTADQALLVDIDLSILGAPSACYDDFEAAIRAEYRWVPLFLYRKKRREVLQGFLARKRIYTNDQFFDSLEAQARANLRRALEYL